MASRMAARSTTAGTPVKSCISTRAGRNAISRSDVLVLSHCATAWMSCLVTERPSSLRNRFSSKNLEREGQPRNPLQAVLFRHRQAVIRIGLGADLERPEALEAIERCHDFFPIPPAGRRRNSEVIYCRNRPIPLPSRPRSRGRKEEENSDVAGVTGAPQPDLRLIRSFLLLCQFSNEWSAKMQGMAQRVAKSLRKNRIQVGADASHRCRTGLSTRRARRLRRRQLCGGIRRGFDHQRPQRRGKIVAFADDRRPSARRGGPADAGRRRPGIEHCRTGPLSRPPGRAERLALGRREFALLGRFLRHAVCRSPLTRSRRSGSARSRTCRLPIFPPDSAGGCRLRG